MVQYHPLLLDVNYYEINIEQIDFYLHLRMDHKILAVDSEN